MRNAATSTTYHGLSMTLLVMMVSARAALGAPTYGAHTSCHVRTNGADLEDNEPFMDVASRTGGTRGCARRNLHVCGAASRCCGSQAGPLWGAYARTPAGGHRSGVADEVAAADASEPGDDSPSTSADRAVAARPLCSSARGFCQLLMVRTHHHQNFGWLAVERGVRSC